MTGPTKAKGKIESVDPTSGTAEVRLANAQSTTANLHFGAFFSGKAVRLPEKGDKVSVLCQDSPEGAIVIAARLLTK